MTKDKKSISDDEFKKFLEPVGSPEIIGELNDWAHAGTKEALNKLEKFIEGEKDEKLRGYAGCAMEECRYFYYSPNSEQEEKDFLLAKMILGKENDIWESEGKAASLKFELENLDLDRKVNEKLVKSAEGTIKQWKYNFSEDYYLTVQNQLAEIIEAVEYLNAWVKMAKSMIKTKKYLEIPPEVLEHIHCDGEGISCCEEDASSCNCNN